MASDPLFDALAFRHLTVKNRLFRSSVSGRFDNYDGSGTEARIRWEEKFARGGVGAIISSHVPISVEGRHLPGYALIDRDDRIPFFRRLGEVVHRHDCKYILQLNHCGRQQDVPGVENEVRGAMSATGRREPFHGIRATEMTGDEVRAVIRQFIDAARRVREAGLDGIELHGANGYLITQFLSSGINDRVDEYGGSIECRARFLLEIIRGIRKEVGADFHLQVKLNGEDRNDAVLFWEKRGNTLADTLRVCELVEEAGVDAIHVSTGSMFPHPWNPPGGLPLDVVAKTYDSMISSGKNVFRNFVLVRYRALRPIMQFLWNRTKIEKIEGINLSAARAIKQKVQIPVICTGGFQTASIIRRAIALGDCDAVAIARPLIANNDLPKQFQGGKERADEPCTYCNKCLYEVLENPLGCYEESRYRGGRDEMMRTIMQVFETSDPTR